MLNDTNAPKTQIRIIKVKDFQIHENKNIEKPLEKCFTKDNVLVHVNGN